MKKTALTTSILFAFGVAGTAGADTEVAETDEPLNQPVYEYDEWTEDNNVRLFKILDDNDDSVLTKDEVSDYPEIENLFPSLDEDGDNELSNREFGEYNPSTDVIEKAREENDVGINGN